MFHLFSQLLQKQVKKRFDSSFLRCCYPNPACFCDSGASCTAEDAQLRCSRLMVMHVISVFAHVADRPFATAFGPFVESCEHTPHVL